MKEVLIENLLHECGCITQGGLVAFMSRNDSDNTNAAIRVPDEYVKTSKKQCLYFSLKLERNDFCQLEGKVDYILDDTSAILIDDMIDEITDVNRMLNVGLVVVDYLPLIRGRSKETRREEMLDILSSLHELAKKLNICILVLLITGRAVEKYNPYPVKKELHQYGDTAGKFIDDLYFVEKNSVTKINELL